MLNRHPQLDPSPLEVANRTLQQKLVQAEQACLALETLEPQQRLLLGQLLQEAQIAQATLEQQIEAVIHPDRPAQSAPVTSLEPPCWSPSETANPAIDSEAELREQAQILRSTYEGVEHSICIINVSAEGEFRFAGWNPSTEKMTGISSAATVGKTPEELLGEPHGAIVRQNYQRCLEAGHSISYEETVPFQGRDITWLTTLNPLKDALGKIYRIVLTTFNITERKAAEAALEQKEYQYRSIFEAINDGIFIVELDTGKVVTVNPANCKMHGYSQSEFMQLQPSDYIHPDSLPIFTNFIATVKAGRRFVGEAVDLHQDGSLINIEVTGVPFCYGDRPHVLSVVRDISEQKQLETDRAAAEQALQKTNTLLNSLLETIPGFFFAKDLEGRHMALNSNLAEFFGKPIAEVIGKTDADLFAPDMAAAIMAKDQAVIRQGVGQRFEEVISIHGVDCTYLTIKTPLRDAAGTTVGLLGLAQDISDLKSMEVSLRQSEQRFRDVTEAAGEYIWEIAADGTYTFVTDRAKAVKGYDPAALIGHTPFEFMSPEDVTQVEAIVQAAAMNKSAFTLEHRNILPSGDIVWEAVNGVPVLNEPGEIIGFRGTGLSITDRKVAEAAIAESEAKFRRLVEGANDLIYAVAPDGTFTYLSPQLTKMWGYEVADLLHQSFTSLVHPDDLPPVLASHQRLFETGKRQMGLEFRLQHHEGHWTWVTCSNSPIKDATGQVIGFQGIARDVSYRKVAEAKLQQKAEELEAALQELQQTQLQMIQSEKMSSLGQLVAGVAHEINNPVSFIYGNITPTDQYAQDLLNLVNLYATHYPEPLPIIQDEIAAIDLDFLKEDLPKTLSSMRMGADRIRQIVNSLRNFSRLDEADYKAVDIHAGLDSTLVILEHRIKAAPDRPAIQVVKQYGELPLVECYAGQLNQVFMNILVNALDALEERDHDRTPAAMQQCPSTITIQTRLVHGDCIAVHIGDNGPGIPKTVQNRVFDPFFTTKPWGKGTGMGMSISYQIVTEKHGGTLECVSAPEQGSEFVVQIPRRQHQSNPLS
ncbi:MAG: PAS domain S-box protein [Leptolyngbyaceae cyanobacterium]